MATQKISLHQRFYYHLLQGRKRLDVQYKRRPWCELKARDTIVFETDDKPDIRAIVKEIREYKSIAGLLANEKHGLLAPGVEREIIEVVVFRGFTRAGINDHGLIVIEFEVTEEEA